MADFNSLFPPPTLLFRQTQHDAALGLLEITSFCACNQDEGSYWLEQNVRATCGRFKIPEGTQRVFLDAETIAKLLPHLMAIVRGG